MRTSLVGELIMVSTTPRYAGSKQHWQLTTADILCGTVAGDDTLPAAALLTRGKGASRRLP
jgi:hypothetical protein